jgi:hypothetical protein
VAKNGGGEELGSGVGTGRRRARRTAANAMGVAGAESSRCRVGLLILFCLRGWAVALKRAASLILSFLSFRRR